MKTLLLSLICLIFILGNALAQSKEVAYTLDDRDRMIRLEEKMNSIDKRFEQIDKRFESLERQFNDRFDDMFRYLTIIVSIFTVIMVANMGFAFWDRRTILKKAREDAIVEIHNFEKELKVKGFFAAIMELSKTNSDVAAVLKNYGIL